MPDNKDTAVTDPLPGLVEIATKFGATPETIKKAQDVEVLIADAIKVIHDINGAGGTLTDELWNAVNHARAIGLWVKEHVFKNS